jgi:hypothetical protein
LISGQITARSFSSQKKRWFAMKPTIGLVCYPPSGELPCSKLKPPNSLCHERGFVMACELVHNFLFTKHFAFHRVGCESEKNQQPAISRQNQCSNVGAEGGQYV